MKEAILRVTEHGYVRAFTFMAFCGLAIAQPQRLEATRAVGDVFAGDTRAAVTLQVRSRGVPVSDILRRVAELTGLDIAAKGDIASEKVVAFVPSARASAILASLGELLGGEWQTSATDEAPPSYRLCRSKRSIQVAEEQFEREVRWFSDALRDRRRALRSRDRRTPPDEQEVALTLVDLLSPRDLASLVREGSLPARPLQMVGSGVADAICAIATRMAEAQMARRRSDPNDQTFEAIRLGIQLPRGSLGPSPDDVMQAGVQFIRSGARLFARVSRGVELYAVYDYESSLPAAGARGDPLAPIEEPQETAGLSAEAVRSAAALPDGMARLERLSDLASCAVYADYYRCRSIVRRPAGEQHMAPSSDAGAGAMDSLCRDFDWLWWRGEGAIYLRSRRWFADRRAEVPETWVTALTQRLEALNGEPTVGDILSFGDLSRAQLRGWATRIGVGTPWEEVLGVPELVNLLRVCQVPATHRLPVLGGGRTMPAVIRGAALSPMQLRAAAAFVEAIGGVADDRIGRLVVRVGYSPGVLRSEPIVFATVDVSFGDGPDVPIPVRLAFSIPAAVERPPAERLHVVRSK